ncbi:GPI ethanolamine phosphate transferase 3 isoform X2 [Aricia agestis]|uniref:GPI ethanolamine phosphate transferase 3 isoform X2 n=1 Tax=Aricia agestis TaxID=91739 RepID=UPI001C202297|nr:GPI ethanolamine phosphate transferase 3 isoform X2 [Aricia agestis]
MKEKWNFILYLLWFSYLIISAVVMFGHGFLLSRKTLSDVSECVPLSSIGCDGREISNSTGGCSEDEKIRAILLNPDSPLVCPPRSQRVVLILVDALRYDFTEYNADLENPLQYQNKLPVITNLLGKWPNRTRVFRFMADPPTTTLQRIKALVTGSLPTFVDVSSNFAAMEIQEDNILDQILKDKHRAILLGDDTWARLMPARWHRKHALYSFHTWDLDTVDTEVDSKIYNELKKDDWELLVAHYLGVDHAGHRYGPNHAEMARKLSETNDRLEKIIEILPADAILYVIGDHGMTETGDHGGESKAERTAAWFSYYPPGFRADDGAIGKEVQQTNLAATVSAALGRPPPAPSLGYVELPVLPQMTTAGTLLCLTNNLKQISKYLLRYGEESQQVSLDRLTQLLNATRTQIDLASAVYSELELRHYIEDVRLLTDNIRNVFREVWVEFDSLSMLRALLLLLLAIFFNWIISEGVPIERIPHVFSSSFVPSGLIGIAVCIGVCYTAFTLEMLSDLEHAIFLSTGLISGVFTCMLVIMHWDGITQKWYESHPLFYERFARTALFASAAVLVSNSYIIEEGAVLSFLALSVIGLIAWNVRTIKCLGLWVGFGVSLALTRPYLGCREEQGDCWTSDSKNSSNASRAALVLALGSMAAVVSIARRYLDWRGYGFVIAGIFSCAHWAVGWGSLGSPGRSKMLARGAWLVIVCTFFLLLKRDSRGATMPLIIAGLSLYVANTLVLGAAFAPTAGLALLSGLFVLNIVAMIKTDGAGKSALSSRYNSSIACLWALLASYYFYGSGHHATLGHVSWAAVFHAGDPAHLVYGHALSAVLMFISLFGMPLMFGVTTPLLALWSRAGATPVGPRTQMAAVFSLCLKFSLCFAVRMFAAALSATIHCRHLMIWGVFTPKLLFEFGACVAALLGSFIGATLTAWHFTTQHRSS